MAIVDDEKLLRQGMKMILEQGNKIEVTDVAENGQDLLDQIDAVLRKMAQRQRHALSTLLDRLADRIG